MEHLAEYSPIVIGICRTILMAALMLSLAGIYNGTKSVVVLDERAFPTPESLAQMVQETHVLWLGVFVAVWGLNNNWLFVPYYQ